MRKSFIRSFIHSFSSCSFIHSFIHSVDFGGMHSNSFIHSLRSFIHSFIRSQAVYSFIRFVHSKFVESRSAQSDQFDPKIIRMRATLVIFPSCEDLDFLHSFSILPKTTMKTQIPRGQSLGCVDQMLRTTGLREKSVCVGGLAVVVGPGGGCRPPN